MLCTALLVWVPYVIHLWRPLEESTTTFSKMHLWFPVWTSKTDVCVDWHASVLPFGNALEVGQRYGITVYRGIHILSQRIFSQPERFGTTTTHWCHPTAMVWSRCILNPGTHYNNWSSAYCVVVPQEKKKRLVIVSFEKTPNDQKQKKNGDTFSIIFVYVSSLRRGHANLLCIVSILLMRQVLSCSPLIQKKKIWKKRKNTPGGTWTHNQWVRTPLPYPLGHRCFFTNVRTCVLSGREMVCLL